MSKKDKKGFYAFACCCERPDTRLSTVQYVCLTDPQRFKDVQMCTNLQCEIETNLGENEAEHQKAA